MSYRIKEHAGKVTIQVLTYRITHRFVFPRWVHFEDSDSLDDAKKRLEELNTPPVYHTK